MLAAINQYLMLPDGPGTPYVTAIKFVDEIRLDKPFYARFSNTRVRASASSVSMGVWCGAGQGTYGFSGTTEMRPLFSRHVARVNRKRRFFSFSADGPGEKRRHTSLVSNANCRGTTAIPKRDWIKTISVAASAEFFHFLSTEFRSASNQTY